MERYVIRGGRDGSEQLQLHAPASRADSVTPFDRTGRGRVERRGWRSE